MLQPKIFFYKIIVLSISKKLIQNIFSLGVIQFVNYVFPLITVPYVSRIIGPIAKPDKIQYVNGLPKTRSGKIMRRILRKIAEGELENLGDITTLLDPGIVEEIKKNRV